MIVKTIDLLAEAPDPRRRAPRCNEPTCDRATREGKPFCPDHIEQQPYVAKLMARLERRDVEQERVRKRGGRAVDVEGPTSQEILDYLRLHGQRTFPRIALDLNISIALTEIYLYALRRKGQVSIDQNRRGVGVAKLRPRRERQAPPSSDAGKETQAA